MEPFSISCTTCQAKLRVRDPSVVGQILTCPKCGSMVLIEAPPERREPPTGSGAIEGTATARPTPLPRPPKLPGQGKRNVSDTVEDPTQYGTREPSAARPAEELAGELNGGLDESEPTRQRPDFGWQEPAAATADTTEPMFAAHDHELAETSADPASDSTASQPGSDDWVSDRSQRNRRWLAVGIAGLGGIGLAVITFVWLANRPAGDQSIAQGTTPPAVPASPTAPPSDVQQPLANPGSAPVAVPPANFVPPTTNDPPAANGSPPQPPNIPAVAPATASPTPSIPENGAPAQPPAPTDEPPAVPSDLAPAPPAPPPPGTDSATAPKSPVGTTEPLPASPNPGAERMLPGGPLAKTLRKLDDLLGADDESPAKEADAGSPAPQPSTDDSTKPPAGPPAEPSTADISKSGSEPPVPGAAPTRLTRPNPREIDLESRLADTLAQVDMEAVPLVDAAQFLTEFSTIPITIDPDSLAWSKLTPLSPVSVKASNPTVSQILSSLGEKTGLVVVPVEQQVLLTRPTTVRKTTRKVDDLVGAEGTGGPAIISLLTRFVAPQTWSANGGTGTVAVSGDSIELEQADAVVLEVSAFLERLRVVRGLPIRSKFDPAVFAPISRTVQASAGLSKRVTLNFSRPTPLTVILRRISRDTNVPIVINWLALASAEWTPDAEISWKTSETTLAESLDTLLKPMDLTYRIAAGGAIQITTLDDLVARPDTEFYPLGDRLGPDQPAETLLEPLRNKTPAEWWQAPISGDLAVDPSSRALIVRLPQPQQRELEQILRDWPVATPAPR